MTSVTWPNNCLFIDEKTFFNCNKLTAINIPTNTICSKSAFNNTIIHRYCK